MLLTGCSSSTSSRRGGSTIKQEDSDSKNSRKESSKKKENSDSSRPDPKKKDKEKESDKQDTPDSSLESTTKTDGVMTVADLKRKHGSLDEQVIKPFYNVNQDTYFSFHYNSMVEPQFAVTVHTDSKCELNSTVHQVTYGFVNKEKGGLDVVVMPGTPFLIPRIEVAHWITVIGATLLYTICVFDMICIQMSHDYYQSQ